MMQGYTIKLGSTATARFDYQSEQGFIWMVDCNEKDIKGALIVCKAVSNYLNTVDIYRSDLAELLVDLDENILPGACQKTGVSGLVASVMIARVVRGKTRLAFVGEARAHVLDQDMKLVFITREHNVFNLYGESIWKGNLGYSEQQAKSTILGVLGGGAAVVEERLIPMQSHGVLALVSHTWHQYELVDTVYLNRLKTVVKRNRDDMPLQPGDAIAVLRW